MKPPKCNRAFAEMLAASVKRKEIAVVKEFRPDMGVARFRQQPLRQPRLHQRNIDSAFIVAIFLAACAVILCAVR